MTLTAADPVKSDLLYFSANLAIGMTHSEKPEYTQNQRRFKPKSSKFKRIRDSIRNDTLITISNSTGRVIDLSNYEPSEEQQQRMDLNSSIINQMTERTISLLRGKVPQEINIPHEIDYSLNLRNNEQKTKSVAEWETTKSCRFDRFMEYIKQKNFVNSIVGEVYHQKIFRKLRWWAEINRTRSEAKMIQKFKSVIGDPSQVVIGIGVWEQRKHMKLKEPTKGKGSRILFKKAGYKVFLIDEFRPNCCCFSCKKAQKTEGAHILGHGRGMRSLFVTGLPCVNHAKECEIEIGMLRWICWQ
ncbi:hypothetical protein P9112_011486 [Eukaryota sp. TZLM1-RC]